MDGKPIETMYASVNAPNSVESTENDSVVNTPTQEEKPTRSRRTTVETEESKVAEDTAPWEEPTAEPQVTEAPTAPVETADATTQPQRRTRRTRS